MRIGIFGKVMAVLIFLALTGNLVLFFLMGESVVKPVHVFMAAYAILLALNLGIVGFGVYYTTKAHEKHEKSSLSWGRRGFVMGGTSTVLFGLAPWFFYPDRDAGFVDISIALLLLGLTTGTFLLSFHREYIRNVGSVKDRRGRREDRPELIEGSSR